MAFSARLGLLLAVLCLSNAQIAVAMDGAAATVVDATGAGTQTVFKQLEYAPAQNAPGTAPVVSDFNAYDGRVLPEGDFWFRFSVRLPAEDSATRFLQIENPRLRHTEIWVFDGEDWRWLSLEAPGLGLGSHISKAPRVSVLVPREGEVVDVMVRMEDPNAFVPRMHVLDAPALRQDGFLSLFVGGLALGMMLLLVAFNAVISVYTRDARYLTLSVYMGASLLFLLHYLGYAQMLFWGERIDWDQSMTHAAGMFTFAAYVPFVARMLSLRDTWYSRVYVRLMWVCGFVELFVGLGALAPVVQITGGIVSIAMHPLALYVALRGNREGWLFIGATFFVLIGGTTTWTEQLWGFGGGTASHMFFLWGNAITSLALVMLLARHIVTLRAERLQSEITARRAQASASDARQEAETKGAFLATMSHEIRTPLNGVLGMAELLSKTRLSSEQESQVSTILRSGQGLMAILNDILDYSKFESGQLVLEQERCDLYVLFDDLAMVSADRIKDKDVSFELRIDPEVPEVVITDPTRLRQILENLLSNASKFTTTGHITLEARTRDDKLVIRVLDTGIGIREADVVGLFERFRQADSSITRKFGGTGLGLAICKLLCDALGGTLSVASEYGQGSTFEITLPCHTSRRYLGEPGNATIALRGSDAARRAAVAKLVERWGATIDPDAPVSYDVDSGIRLVELRRLCCTIEQDPLEETSTPLNGYRLLVAEDNQTNQLIARKTLTLFGAEVDIANNGQEALEKCAAKRYDLILMDCDMPVMDGYTASQTIREEEAQSGRSATPIIALTAHAGAEYRERAEASGMDAYLAKPLRQRVLLETILQVASVAHR